MNNVEGNDAVVTAIKWLLTLIGFAITIGLILDRWPPEEPPRPVKPNYESMMNESAAPQTPESPKAK